MVETSSSLTKLKLMLELRNGDLWWSCERVCARETSRVGGCMCACVIVCERVHAWAKECASKHLSIISAPGVSIIQLCNFSKLLVFLRKRRKKSLRLNYPQVLKWALEKKTRRRDAFVFVSPRKRIFWMSPGCEIAKREAGREREKERV